MTDELKVEIVKTVGQVAGSAIFGWSIVNLFRGRPAKIKVAGVPLEDYNNTVNQLNKNIETTNKNWQTAVDRFKNIDKKLKAIAEKDSKLARQFEEIDNEY